MKELVYNTILENGRINIKKLIKKTGLSKEEIEGYVRELKLDGEIVELGNKYMVMPDDYYMGTVIVSSTLKKYIEFDNKKISISSNFYYDVIVDDLVCFRLNNDNKAEIISVIDRPISKMTCEVRKVRNSLEIIPFREGMSVKLSRDDMKEIMDGDIIVVSIPAGEIGEYYENKLISKIGRRDDPFIDDAVIAYNYGFDDEYSEEYMEEVRNIPTEVSEAELENRVDYRKQKSFTIDGMYTKDMDDGVFAEVLDNNIIRVYVHIADVSHYIKKGSEIYKRACDKTTSLYMNNSVYHMLHHIISNGICSLNPNVDRLAKTVVMDIDEDGNVVDYNVVKSVINSKMKMVYEDVDCILNDLYVPLGYEDFVGELKILSEASDRLDKRFKIDGRIEFANTELNKIYNDDGTIDTINTPVDSKGRRLIENLMICSNELVAKWLLYMEMPAVYRVHELPDVAKINSLIGELNNQGYGLRRLNTVDNPEVIQKLLDRLRGYDGFETLSQLFVMSMKRARYTTNNYGHYALSLPAYLHFTSPIRRLPDLLVHGVCDIILEDYEKMDEINFGNLEKELEELAVRSSTMERLADAAEREAERRLVIEKMDTMVGDELEAVVCEVGKRIRIKLYDIDTYINHDNLDNRFIFDVRARRYFDSVTNQYLDIGSKVYVKLVSVNKFNNSFEVNVIGTKNSVINSKKLARKLS